MTNVIIDNIYLAILLPLWIFLIIMCGRFFAIFVNKHIIHAITLLSSFLGIFITGFAYLKLEEPIIQAYSFIKINNFAFNIGLQIDKLSLSIALLLFLVSFCVEIFSISYLKNQEKQYRFFALLSLFNFAMCGLLFSPNLFQLYIFWEVVSVISYLLIGYDYNNSNKSLVSRRVLLMNRFGDTCLFGAICLSSFYMYSYSNNTVFASLDFEDFNAISTLLYAYTTNIQFIIISAMFIIAAIIKSAQFPFHTWLQDAMEAKLPVSALLHSATMVVLGVFLLIRIFPILEMQESLLSILIIVGIVTAIFCSIRAFIESHPKKLLAYSTSANLGLMVLAVGLLDTKIAVIMLVAHGLVKSMFFLTIPQQNKNYNYINWILFLIGSLSLSGIAFAGLIPKEIIYNDLSSIVWLKVAFCFVSFMTGLYIFRLSLLMIKEKEFTKEYNYIEIFPCIILIITNIAFYVFLKRNIKYEISLPFWYAILSWVTIFIIYKTKHIQEYNIEFNFFENIYNYKIPNLYTSLSLRLSVIEHFLLNSYKIPVFISKYIVKFTKLIEDNVVNKGISLVVKSCKKLSEVNNKLQKRNIQIYNAYALIIIAFTISLVIISYTIILNNVS